jgi:hypothetical protein
MEKQLTFLPSPKTVSLSGGSLVKKCKNIDGLSRGEGKKVNCFSMVFLNAQGETHSETCFRQPSRTAGNPYQTKPEIKIPQKILPDLDGLCRCLQTGSWQLE